MWGVASVLTRRGEWHEFKSWLVRESDCVINPPVLLRGRKYQQRNLIFTNYLKQKLVFTIFRGKFVELPVQEGS